MATGTIPYDEPIDRNTDWGGDSSTGGRPVAGGRVQDFIKGALQNLEDKIKNISGLGRFLSGWDCTTGLAVTDPKENPYKYPVGSFYIVAKVGEKNYRPTGTAYGIGAASTELETKKVKVNDIYKYDGTSWMLIELDNPEIPNFTNETAGLIRGKASDGYVEAEDGFGKVHGWDSKMDVVGNATNETAGLMSATDKEKLDGLENLEVVQTTGTDTTVVMSQKAVTVNLSTNLKLAKQVEYINTTLMPSLAEIGQADYINFSFTYNLSTNLILEDFFLTFIQASIKNKKDITVFLYITSNSKKFGFILADSSLPCVMPSNNDGQFGPNQMYEISIYYNVFISRPIIIFSNNLLA